MNEPTPVTVSNSERQSWANATTPMVSALEDLLSQRQVRRERHRHLAASNSRAMAELAATKRLQAYLGTPTRDAVNFADQLLIAAEDHFAAICRLIVHDEPVLYADKVLARAGIEACGRAAWLLDPSLDAMHRARRGVTQRFATIKANADLLKKSPDGSKFCRDRRDALIDECLAAGLHPTQFNGTAAIGDRIPSERSAMRKALTGPSGDDFDFGAFSQTWLSRFVHSDPAGLMENLTDTLPLGVDAPSVAGSLTKGLAAGSDRANIILAMCASSYVKSADAFLLHQGWIDDDWSKTTANLRGIVRASIQLPRK